MSISEEFFSSIVSRSAVHPLDCREAKADKEDFLKKYTKCPEDQLKMEDDLTSIIFKESKHSFCAGFDAAVKHIFGLVFGADTRV